MRPPVVGFAPHVPSLYWDRVALGLVSAMQYLESISMFQGTDESEAMALLVTAREYASRRRTEAQRALAEFRASDPARFRRCFEGLEPWPDEDAMSFTGRCTCRDLCFHRFEDPADRPAGLDELGYRGLIESPGFVCKCPGVRPACPVPGHPVEDDQ